MIKNFNSSKATYLLFILVLFICILIYQVLGSQGNSVGYLNSGENDFNFSYGGFYASNVLKLNPEIEVIVYYDSNLQRNFSYVNALGGVGRNFEIYPGLNYKIYSSEDINLIAP